MATLKDVADRAGVTVTTVSRILNNRGYISEKTRERVYAVMKEIDYQPNEIARALSLNKNNSIGIIVASLMHPFFSASVNYFEYYASLQGYKVMVCNSQRSKEKEIAYIDMLRSNKVSGIIIGTRNGELDERLPPNLPVVTFERAISDRIPTVMCDNYQGGILATKHLVNSGCRHLAILCGSKRVHLPADDRTQAFIDECRKSRIEPVIFATDEAQFESRQYTTEIAMMLDSNKKIDGIFATSDVMAAQVIQVCSKRRIRIPQDIKLVGFDDVEISRLTTPTLTTVHQPIEQMCNSAVSLIIRQLRGEPVPSKTVLPVSLIERESTSRDLG